MQALNKKLKRNLILLSLIFPLSFSFIGLIMGLFFYSRMVAIILLIAGLIMGILLNIVCYYRKYFTIALYQAPIPSLMFFLFWWISNAFVSDFYAFLIACGGLTIGLWLNNELIEPFKFYKIKKRWLAIFYLFFSIIFLSYFRFMPAFNILLGVLAGNYLSIRVISNYRKERTIIINLRQGAAYTSGVLFFIMVLAGFIATFDMETSILHVHQIFNITLSPAYFLLLISIGGIILVILQYYLTLFTAKTMLQLWKYRRFKRYSKK